MIRAGRLQAALDALRQPRAVADENRRHDGRGVGVGDRDVARDRRANEPSGARGPFRGPGAALDLDERGALDRPSEIERPAQGLPQQIRAARVEGDRRPPQQHRRADPPARRPGRRLAGGQGSRDVRLDAARRTYPVARIRAHGDAVDQQPDAALDEGGVRPQISVDGDDVTGAVAGPGDRVEPAQQRPRQGALARERALRSGGAHDGSEQERAAGRASPGRQRQRRAQQRAGQRVTRGGGRRRDACRRPGEDSQRDRKARGHAAGWPVHARPLVQDSRTAPHEDSALRMLQKLQSDRRGRFAVSATIGI